MCSGCLSVQSLAVWADRDSANTQWTHSSIQHTADLWSICDSSRDNLLLLLDFPLPDILSVAICPPRTEIKETTRALIYQSTLNYLQDSWTESWIMSPQDLSLPSTKFFYLPSPDVFLRILMSIDDKPEVDFGVKTAGPPACKWYKNNTPVSKVRFLGFVCQLPQFILSLRCKMSEKEWTEEAEVSDGSNRRWTLTQEVKVHGSHKTKSWNNEQWTR